MLNEWFLSQIRQGLGFYTIFEVKISLGALSKHFVCIQLSSGLTLGSVKPVRVKQLESLLSVLETVT